MTSDPLPTVPFAADQGTLSLDFRGSPGLTIHPLLHLVTPAESGAEAFALRLAQALVEIGNGTRSPHQLVRWTSSEVHEALVRRSEAMHRTVRHPRRVRAQVRSVHISHPTAGVAEMSVHVGRGERSSALAVRIEQRDGRWCCTAVTFG